MSAFDRIEDFIFWAVTTSAAAIAAGVWWMIRLVFTSQQQIEMLRTEMAHRDALRADDREDTAQIRASVSRIENILLEKGTHK